MVLLKTEWVLILFYVNFYYVGNLLRAANSCLQNSTIFENRRFSFVDLLS